MTLFEIVKQFENIAKNMPNINYVGNGDIYSLSTLPNVDYSVFFITQQSHSLSENTIDYNLTLFYVDRLTGNGSNKLAIQSNGITMLANIINVFAMKNEDVEVNYDIQYNTFLQRFADECAGCYCNVTITVDNNVGICGMEG